MMLKCWSVLQGKVVVVVLEYSGDPFEFRYVAFFFFSTGTDGKSMRWSEYRTKPIFSLQRLIPDILVKAQYVKPAIIQSNYRVISVLII
jgi:hypothetical protein